MKEKSSLPKLSRRKILLFGGFSFTFSSIVLLSRIKLIFASKAEERALVGLDLSGKEEGAFRESDFESKSVFLNAEGQIIEERDIKVQGYVEIFEDLA